MRAAFSTPDQVYRRRWATLIVVCVSLMVIGLDNTILNVALPTLQRDLHASTSALQWIVDTYILVFAGLLLTAGSLGDRFGRYKTLTLGLVIFGVGSLASALSGSAAVLIATRGFMGIGGALIMPATLSIITNTFLDPVERAKAIGVWAGVSALGVGIGPVAGGFLLAHFYWGSVFFVNVPVTVIAVVAGYFLVPDSKDPTAPRLDPIGALLSVVGLATVLWAVIEAPSDGWGATNILAAFAIGAVILAGFVAWELHTDHPMLDIRFFENPRFTAASGAITMTFFALFGSLFLLTQYLQSVLGYSPLKAGALLIPQAMVMMVVAPSSSSIVLRLGNKVVVATGLLIAASAMGVFATLTPTSPLAAPIAVTVLLGIGMGLIFAPATDSIMGSLPREKAGVGSAMNDTTRQTGGAVGVAVLGSVMASRYRSALTASAHAAHVPANVLAVAKNGIGAAVRLGPTVAGISKEAFVSGLHVGVLMGAGVLLLAATGVVLWLPARARDADEIVISDSQSATVDGVELSFD